MSIFKQLDNDLVDIEAAPAARVHVLAAIAVERRRQIEKWGPQRHPDGTGRMGFRVNREHYTQRNDERETSGAPAVWADILLEEVFEALAETDPAKLAIELVQVAAVAAAWVEDIDAR